MVVYSETGVDSVRHCLDLSAYIVFIIISLVIISCRQCGLVTATNIVLCVINRQSGLVTATNIVLCVINRQPGLVTATNGPNTKCRVRLDRDMAEKWSVQLVWNFC